MTVYPIPAFTDNYIWALINEQNHSFVCVDPGLAAPVYEFASSNQLTLEAILLTHHHQDHIGGVAELIKYYPQCYVYGPQDSRLPKETKSVDTQTILQYPPFYLTVLVNPGHTSTHISYYESNQGWLFCGDTLFSGGCGRVFDGTIEQLYQSLVQFQGLPKATKIFCAHEYTKKNLQFARLVEPNNQELSAYLHLLEQSSLHCSLPTTLEREQAVNPFLRLSCPEVQQYALQHGAQSSTPLDVFRTLRREKDRY